MFVARIIQTVYISRFHRAQLLCASFLYSLAYSADIPDPSRWEFSPSYTWELFDIPISVMTIGQRIKRLETQSHLGGDGEDGGDGNLFGDIPSFPG